MINRILIATALLFALSTPAHAHLLPSEHGSFAAGFSHPLFGLDHILAMVAVGVWALGAGGRAVWIVPGAFVAMMGVGFVFALAGGALPFVEPMILASVVAIGLLIAFAVRLPVAASAMVVGAFAVFHGYAHGTEIGAAGALTYGTGFVAATVLLHGAGIGIGAGLVRLQIRGDMIVRVLGAGTATAGLALLAV